MKYNFKIISTGIIAFILAAALAVGNSIKGEETAHVHALDTAAGAITWTHLSTENGDLEPPSGSLEQTTSLILDINKDGTNDFVIGTRKSPGPSLVWYERNATGWIRHVIESNVLRIEAGGAYHDIDNDGDLDIVMGDDASGNEVWWWENPYPNYSSEWTRRLIKNTGGDKHHDQMFGDFDDDGKTELVFWNQGDKKLILAEIPNDPRNSGTWSLRAIYSWSSPSHEGLAQADIDNDGVIDIVGGGRWFKLESGGNFTANLIASGMETTRAAAGQLVKGGRPEVVFVPGETSGPLIWYEWDGSSWIGTQLAANVDHGHSLQIEDIDKDGNLDIFAAEMRLNSNNPNAKVWVFFGDGNGNFTATVIASGYGNHESRVADLDGDGDIDVLGKPYNWDTPRVDIWLSNLNGASCKPSLDNWKRHVIDGGRPQRAIFVFPGDLNGDGLADVVSGAWWYQNPGSPAGSWQRKTIGSPLNNVAAVYDLDKDGDLDILGTEGVGSAGNDHFVWARNNGSGNFTILSNIQTADGDFLQGMAVDEFVSGDTEVALSWHKNGKGVQVLDVPSNPSSSTWSWRQISPTSQDEGLSSGDIDRDGDKDLLLGTKWLRNDAQSTSGSGPWSVYDLFNTSDPPDRNRLADMNGDGRLDAVVGYEAISKEGTLAWYEQPGVATDLWTEHVIANNVIGPQSLDVADMDGDGDIDVVVGEHDLSSDAAPRMLVYEHPGSETGTWTRHVVHTGDEHHDGAQLVDIDNDGDLDIISIGWSHDDVLLYENLSCSGGSQPQPTATNTPVPGPTNTPKATPVPGPITFGIYISSSSGGLVNGISYNDEDILVYDPEANTWSLFLDGSDVGLAGSSTLDIDAFHVYDDNRILFSVAGASSIPDVGSVDDSDLILFTPTSLGTNSAGHFSLYFDGSDVDLSTDNEDIDSIAVLENGDLVISTLGGWSVGSISGDDEDLIRFAPINLGSNTSGSWSLYFDGSDVGLDTSGEEDVWGAGVDGSSGSIYLTFKGNFSVSGVSGDGADVIKCQPASLGDNTSCAFDLVLDGSANGLAGEYLDGLALRGLPGGNDNPTETPTPTPTNTPAETDTPTATPPSSAGAGKVYASSSTEGSAGGVVFDDEDIIVLDTSTGNWSMYFDGSDVGLDSSGAADIDAFHLLADGSILMSMAGDAAVPDLGLVEDSDIIQFVPQSLGNNTAGSFNLYFDGSDVDLTTLSDDIDALFVFDNGDLLVSMAGGDTAGGISFRDEDILLFSPTSLGSNTAGSWSLYFDGSDVGLNDYISEDVWGVWLDETLSDIYFTTKDIFDVANISGDGADIVICQPSSIGTNTACSFMLELDGSTSGLSGEYFDGIWIEH